jgi:hypothetical protein
MVRQAGTARTKKSRCGSRAGWRAESRNRGGFNSSMDTERGTASRALAAAGLMSQGLRGRRVVADELVASRSAGGRGLPGDLPPPSRRRRPPASAEALALPALRGGMVKVYRTGLFYEPYRACCHGTPVRCAVSATLIESYLVARPATWDSVHDEAERLEHAVSGGWSADGRGAGAPRGRPPRRPDPGCEGNGGAPGAESTLRRGSRARRRGAPGGHERRGEAPVPRGGRAHPRSGRHGCRTRAVQRTGHRGCGRPVAGVGPRSRSCPA